MKLYKKCKEMLVEEISTDVFQLNSIRTALASVDKNCFGLSLVDTEKLWVWYENFHGTDIPVDRDWVKRFLKFITGLSNTELEENYKIVNLLFEKGE